MDNDNIYYGMLDAKNGKMFSFSVYDDNTVYVKGIRHAHPETAYVAGARVEVPASVAKRIMENKDNPKAMGKLGQELFNDIREGRLKPVKSEIRINQITNFRGTTRFSQAEDGPVKMEKWIDGHWMTLNLPEPEQMQKAIFDPDLNADPRETLSSVIHDNRKRLKPEDRLVLDIMELACIEENTEKENRKEAMEPVLKGIEKTVKRMPPSVSAAPLLNTGAEHFRATGNTETAERLNQFAARMHRRVADSLEKSGR